jgi:hypothetical protein
MLNILKKFISYQDGIKILAIGINNNDLLNLKNEFGKSEISLISNNKNSFDEELISNIKLIQYDQINFNQLNFIFFKSSFDCIIDATNQDQIEKIKMFNFLFFKLNNNATYFIKNFYIDSVKIQNKYSAIEQINEWALIKK